MPFMTIGATTIEVLTDGANEVEPYLVGQLDRAFDGTMLSSIRVGKRAWEFRTLPMIETDAAAFEALAFTYAAISVSGDFVGGATVSCYASHGGSEFIPEGLSHRRIVSFRLDEA
jgi:hypothetical protein